ncbi:hypothetical protein KZ969_004557, partial [Salmonella enterica subsp. enterica serovar Johannesburg]|nr:hypothetical protein [Salmonella enterica subsp. enterica serovar Johannesburg]ELR0242465.1 hypothetical protein [Salmonella enterica subsp. enterica]
GDISGEKILEPCFGEGAFLKGLIGVPRKIDAIDVDEKHFSSPPQIDFCNFIHLDFIDYHVNPDKYNKDIIATDYDGVICNPPYGLKFTQEYRKVIKNAFPEVYARESYGLFFYFSLLKLKPNGHYVFIIPDTFLSSRNLTFLRRFIVDFAAPEYILKFKSKRFESVNFGYGNLCIISGFKRKLGDEDIVKVIDENSIDRTLLQSLDSGVCIEGKKFRESVKEAWIFGRDYHQDDFSSDITLGDIADCKTGIYTGDNERFCGFDENNPPSRINGHPISLESIKVELDENEKKNGLIGTQRYVKFIRGGHRKPLEKTSHGLLWTPESIKFYATDKKARLQNRTFYFKKGLAVPMVTSGRISASLFDNAVFDQGVVGVFPKKEIYTAFLLIYLNSEFATKQKNLVAPGANNSANYLKKMKIPNFKSDDLNRAQKILEQAIIKGWDETDTIRKEFMNSLSAG